MSRLTFVDVTFAYDARSPLFSIDSLQLTAGEIVGLVGANGCGKSTLLRLLDRTLAPSTGRVLHQPGDLHLVHHTQLDRPTEALRALFHYELPGAAARIAQFALGPDWLERWEQLSPGERRRCTLAAALAEEPDVLLLDEPENHLDTLARAQLERALRHTNSLVVLVAHERTLLDALTTRTLWLEHGELHDYAGSFSFAERERQARRARTQREREELRRDRDHAKRQLGDARRNRAAAASSLGSRAKNPNDHDGKSMGHKVVAGWAEAKAGRTVQVKRQELARAEQRLAAAVHHQDEHGEVRFPYQAPRERRLGTLITPQLQVGERILLRDLHVVVERDTRARLRGGNGTGKSTLLRALAEAVCDREVLYLPQELEDDGGARWLAATAALPRDERGHVLSAFACLGGRAAELSAGVLSPGEQRKLAIAHGLGRGAVALLLDEPENHLDLPSRLRLEQALTDYQGALVLISHEDTFAAQSLQVEWRIEAGFLVLE